MRLATALAYFGCLGFAQSSATLDAIRYPPLAAAVRIHGDVLVSAGSADTGDPLLREAALRGIDLLNFRALQTSVLFHFILVENVQSTRTQVAKKGDAFDRFFLKVLRISTVKKVAIHECAEGPNAPANRIDSTKDPIEVWVYGNVPCVTVDYAGTLDWS